MKALFQFQVLILPIASSFCFISMKSYESVQNMFTKHFSLSKPDNEAVVLDKMKAGLLETHEIVKFTDDSILEKGEAPIYFQKVLSVLNKLLHERNKNATKSVQISRIFESNGKLFRIEGNGDVCVVSNDTQITLNLCHSRSEEWKLLEGLHFIRCTFMRFPPKRAAYKIKPKQKDWLYPLLPGVTIFCVDEEGTFLFPDMESLEELEKGSYGLTLDSDKSIADTAKKLMLKKIFYKFLKEVYGNENSQCRE